MAEIQSVTASFVYCIFTNASSGWVVNLCKTDKGEKVNITGINLPQTPKVKYEYSGKWKDYNGKPSFAADMFEEILPEDKDEILAYLTSGIIKGIGKKTAENIYRSFGKNVFEIIEKEPEKLLSIKGISKKKVDVIRESYGRNKKSKETVKYLIKYGITSATAFKVYEILGENSLFKIKENPYRLYNIHGISFETADALAKKQGNPMDSVERFAACADSVLRENECNGGNIGMEQNEFAQSVFRRLSCTTITYGWIQENTIRLIKSEKLSFKKIKTGKEAIGYISRAEIFNMEKDIAQAIIELKGETKIYKDIDKYIRMAEETLGIGLDEDQYKTIKECFSENISVITGGPGTGKTTIIKVAAFVYEHIYEENEMIFLAPTGRAARMIKNATGYCANTIHSYLGVRSSETLDENEEEKEIENSFVVIDEFSMADIYICNKLFSALKSGNKIFLVGDVDQLPSVGPGAILKDIIESGVIKVARLNTLHRQKENSQIHSNCKKIKTYDTDIKEGNDFHMIEMNNLNEIQSAMAKDYIESVNKYGIEEVICLCPYKEHSAGVFNMNKILQQQINPSDYYKHEITKGGTLFREGDAVMQLKNSGSVANGDTGIIKTMCVEGKKVCLTVEFFCGEVKEYDYEKLDELTLAYACTIHKSQGSEYKKVITCLTNFHKRFCVYNMPYTDFSRAAEEVNFYGERSALNSAIMNHAVAVRITFLKYWLQYYGGQFIAIPA